MSEPRELAPIVLFANRPGIGGVMKMDFRPTPVKAEDAAPIALPVPPAEELDPKANSSATASVTSSGIGSFVRTTPAQTSIQLPAEGSSASAETGSLPPNLTIQPGSSRPLVGPIGPTPVTVPPSTETPSSQGEDKP
jgi:hypothetical protein